MNKFQTLMADNSSATLKRRAGSIATKADIAAQTVVNELKNHVSSLELKIDQLVDFAPDSTDSLTIGAKDWNPDQWARELQKTKWELYLAKEQLKIAEETYKEYFTNTEEK